MSAAWVVDDDLLLVVNDRHVGSVEMWTDDKTGELAWWSILLAPPEGGLPVRQEARIFQTAAGACRAVAEHFGVDLPPPADLLLEIGEEPSDPAEARDVDTSLESRLLDLLVEITDAVLLTVRDTLNGHDVEARLDSFRRDLAERAAELLEEAGR